MTCINGPASHASKYYSKKKKTQKKGEEIIKDVNTYIIRPFFDYALSQDRNCPKAKGNEKLYQRQMDAKCFQLGSASNYRGMCHINCVTNTLFCLDSPPTPRQEPKVETRASRKRRQLIILGILSQCAGLHM